MVFPRNQMYFNITKSYSFFYDLWSVLYRNPIWYRSSSIFVITTFTLSFAVFSCLYSCLGFVLFLVGMLTVPNKRIHSFIAYSFYFILYPLYFILYPLRSYQLWTIFLVYHPLLVSCFRASVKVVCLGFSICLL